MLSHSQSLRVRQVHVRVCTCRYAAVEKDCNTALALEEDYVKAYLRRGVARRHLGKFSEAIQGTCI